MSIAIKMIPTGAALGAEISGVDLVQPIDDATFTAIGLAYNDHGIVFFRDRGVISNIRFPVAAPRE